VIAEFGGLVGEVPFSNVEVKASRLQDVAPDAELFGRSK
jgi:hypothetical protein